MNINEQNFESFLNTDKLVVLDFYADWCGPCKTISPVLDGLSTEYGDKITVGKINVDESPNLSAKYGIRSIPAIFFIKGGEIVDKQMGGTQKSVLVEKINKLI